MLPQQYCLRWKHHHSNVQNMFSQLLEKERFCDVTLYCSPSFASQLEKGDTVVPDSIKGVSLRAHRVVLAACSELLGALLGAHEAHGEPVLVIDGASPEHVRALLDYMYTGEMNVPRSQLQSLLKTAEELKVKGLTDLRWNNKDEPPDCKTDAVTATAAKQDLKTYCRNAKPSPPQCEEIAELKTEETELRTEKYCVNGGPPPLIKLPNKDRSAQSSPTVKRESNSDTEDQNSNVKRQRMTSGMENTDDEDRDQEWQHGNLDITAERVVGWGDDSGGSWPTAVKNEGEREDGMGEGEGEEEEDDEWGEAPADIGSFLHTRLRVDGDNSADESNDGAPPSTSSSLSTAHIDLPGIMKSTLHAKMNLKCYKPNETPTKCGPSDPRFADVVKLNDYLRHGRRPQFWEEDYVKRVMESIRLKELEMKQAAEILGVSYGTLYGRYRDAYGCINRPFRTARDLWSTKGATEILDRLKRGDIPMEVAAQALGVTTRDLFVHFHEIQLHDKEFEPIPIEIDPSLRVKTSYSSLGLPSTAAALTSAMSSAMTSALSASSLLVGKKQDNEGIPATVIRKRSTTNRDAGRWRMPDPLPSSSSTSPSHEVSSPTLLMKSRPDLTIVAAKKSDKNDEGNGT